MKLPLVALLTLVVTVSIAPAAPPQLEKVQFEQKIGAVLPLDASFRDEMGAPIRLGSLFGQRPVILVLAYYECPSLCTVVLNGLLETVRNLRFDIGRDYDVVVVSIKPNDSPALAAAKHHTYATRYGRPGTAGGWHFLTGDAAAIGALTSAVGFHYVASANDFAHPSGIVVCTSKGTASRYFLGIEYPPRDVRLALVEASQQKLGTVSDHFTLICSSFDPHTGRYSLVISRVIRTAGIGTALGLGALILALRRRETVSA